MKSLLRIGLLLSLTSVALAAPGLSIQGRLLKPDGTAVENNSVQFRVQIRSAGVENCLLFEETFTKDMTASEGVFALNIGTGTRVSSTIDGGYSLSRIFANRGTLSLAGTTPAACSSGTTYTPGSDDQRKLVYQFNDGSGWETVPTMNISYAPIAIEALQVGGFAASNLIRAVDGSGNPATGLALNTSQVTELSALIGGTTSQYIKPSSTVTMTGTVTFSNAPQYSGTVSGNNDLANKAYVDSAISSISGGGITSLNGASQASQSFATPTLAFATSLAPAWSTNTGTGVHTLNIPMASDTGVTAGLISKTQYDTFNAKLSTSTSFSGDVSGAYNSTSVDKIKGTAVTITSLTSGDILKYNGTAWVNSAPSGSGITTFNGSTQASQSFAAPTLAFGTSLAPAWSTNTGTGVHTLNIPMASDTGVTAGLISKAQYDTFNNKLGTSTTFSGDVSGAYNSTSVDKIKGTGVTITSLTSGDYLKYNGTAWVNSALPASLSSLNGSSQATQTFATPTLLFGTSLAPAWSTNTGTGVHTLNIPMASDTGVTAGLISKTQYDTFNNKLGTSTTFSGDVSGAYNSTSVDKIKGTGVTITSLTSGDYLKYNGTAWVNAALSTSDLGSGTLPIARGGTNSSTALTNGKVMVSSGGAIVEGNASNTAKSNNTFVMRDGSGNIAGALGTFDQFALNGSVAGTLGIYPPSSFTSWNLTLPTSAGSNGQVLTTNGSGVTSWTSMPSTSALFAQDGNSFSAAATLGTNDNNSLNFETNGTTQMTILPSGNVGIGSTNPTGGKLVVSGRMVASVATDADALAALTVDFASTNLIRATQSGDCGTLNVQNTTTGAMFTLTIVGATKSCATIQWNGSATGVKLSSDYSANTTVSGIIYSFFDDGANLWVSAVPY